MNKIILKESVIKKIQMAKLFYELGNDCFKIIENIERVGAGIILLQDSVELFLIAICEQLEIDYNPRTIKFMQYFEIIENKLKGKMPNEEIPLKSEMIKLNKMRVDIKHYGFRPNIDDCKDLHSYVHSFFIELSKRYLKVDFNSISLVNLLNDDILKGLMKQAEVNLKEEKYRECQINCRKTLYLVFEKQFDIRPFEKYEEDIQSKNALARAISGPHSLAPYYAKNSQYIRENVKEPTDYIVVDYSKLQTELLIYRILPVDLWNIFRLTPEVYYFEEEKNWAIKDEFLDHSYDEKNAEYCFRKTMDILLIKQKYINIQKFKENRFEYVQIRDTNAKIFNKASIDSKVNFTMKKGTQYNLEVRHKVKGLYDNDYYYYLLGREIGDMFGEIQFFGYINEKDIDKQNLSIFPTKRA